MPMKQFEEIKEFTMILMDILGEGFYDIVELSPENYRKYRFEISKAQDIEHIRKFLHLASEQIQKFAKTQINIDDNEMFCCDTGSDKLLVPFYFIDEYIHLLFRIIDGFEISGTEEFISICISWCNCHDDSALQEPDENYENLFKKGLVPVKEYKKFCEFKKRSFRKEYYSVCRDVINNRKDNASFFDWPLRKLSETLNTLDWNENDGLISSRTIERMKGEKGSRRWSTIKDIISISACDRYRTNDKVLKEYEIFQARILMAYFLENFVNSKTLLKSYKQADLYNLLENGLVYKL